MSFCFGVDSASDSDLDLDLDLDLDFGFCFGFGLLLARLVWSSLASIAIESSRV